ncbi:MAG: AI-2E family transporter [bacterium]|nr:AI-2E family transporter [bacterium]
MVRQSILNPIDIIHMNTKEDFSISKHSFVILLFIGLFGWYIWSIRSVLTVPILYVSLSIFFWKYRRWEGVPILWTILSFLFAIYCIYTLAPLLPVAIITLLFNLLLRPLVNFLVTKGWKRWIAVVVVFIASFGTLVLLISLFIPALIKQITFFAKLVPVYYDRLSRFIVERVIPTIQNFPYINEIELDQLKENALQWIKQILSTTASLGSDIVSKIGNLINQLLNFILIPILTIYLLLDQETLFEKVIKIVPPEKRELTTTTVHNISSILSRWLRGQIFVAAFLGVSTSFGLWLIGVDYSLMIGILTAVLSFVPYVGLIISLAFAMLVGFTSGGDLWTLIRILIVYVAIQFIEGNFVTPKIMGRAVGLSDFVTIVVIAIGAQLFGFLGMIFAVPVTATVWVTLREWYTNIYLPSQQKNESSSDTP